jgi:DNA polymerase I
MSQNKPLFILIDASSYFFRAYHALPPLTNSKGHPTGAVYGVINMIRRLIKDYEPDYLGVVFDSKGKTFRDDLYAEYKANRDETPDELSCQFAPLIKIIEAMGLPLLVEDGVEADDVIGTLARQGAAQGFKTIISTGDKDMAQLVNDKISLINTMTNKDMDIAGVKEKFGVSPEQIIDYLTLMGDKVDNIPGVEKVGPKTAAKWLNDYDDLDAIIEHADEFKGKVGENLRAALSYLPLSKKLVTIKDDVPLKVTVTDLTCQAQDTEKLVELYKEMEFRGWLDKLLQNTDESAAPAVAYETVTTEADFDKWLKKLKSAKLFAFDTETSALNYMRAELVGISVSVKAGEAAYIPLAHDYEGAPEQLSRDFVLTQLKPLLEDASKPKIIGQHIKYDMNVLSHYDIDVKAIAFDTMLESYVLNSTASRHDMDSLALKYLGKRTIHFEEVAGSGKKQLTFNQVTLDKAAPYAAEDADITLQLHEALWPKFSDEPGLTDTLKLELSLVPILARMEQTGVLIDKDLLAKQSVKLAKIIKELEAQAYDISGKEFNLNSPKQLQAILFDDLKLPVLQKTPKGQPSTAESVLHELAHDYPLPDIILKFRSLSKLKSTYTDALPLQISDKTGRVHTSYNQAVAATGRLSSTEPNLQNIPVRTEEGRLIRQAFIAPTGYKIVSADYSQIELRIIAHLSGDPALKKAFDNGLDIHRATASEVLGVALEDVTHDQRRSAKAVNFGLIYGMSAFGLAKQLDCDRTAAQSYIDRYFARFPGVKTYMEDTRAKAHDCGYVETLFGRRLYLPDINASNVMRQKAAERTAINAPMQGTAADIIKKAMVNVHDYLEQDDIDARMIMQVHDELVFEVKAADVDRLIEAVRKRMCHAVELSVPIEVGIGVGDNWDEAH